MTRLREVTVIGAGLAGLQTVLALRARGYAGRLRLVGAERRPPYDRPPLSKAVLRADLDDTTLEADWTALGVDPELGRRVTSLPARRSDAEAVVIATGADPVRLGGTDSVFVLRTHEDAMALRAALLPGIRVVVVGAGWLGAEVATAAAARGAAVTAVEALPAPLAGALPPRIGRLTVPWWHAAGVELRTGERVEAVSARGVQLRGGARLGADVVVVAVGVRPATGWLAGSGVALGPDGAVLVDRGLRAGVPGVWAVGDCAAWESARYARRLRVEHWDNALRGPAVVAANVLGGAEVYDPVPYFWSEQFGRMVQYAGHHPVADRLVLRGDPGADPTWTVLWLTGDGRLVALLAVDRPRDLLQGRRLMERAATVAVARASDPAVPLRDATARP